MRLFYCCLTTADKVDIVMKNYGKINSLDQIEDTDVPQFISGRILPVSNRLTAPISGKPCVYYDVRVEQLVERTDENGLSGDHQDGKVWEFRCGERVAADFTLFDPAFPSLELYVPGTQVQINVHATEEIRAKQSKVIKQSKIPNHTKEFLEKHQFKCTDAKGKLEKNIRFREANFEFGEQIAVLGIVRNVTDDAGTVRKVLFPVNKEVFTEEFCAAKGWSDWDRRSWQDLTRKPSIILTDMPQYFQNIQVDPLPPQMNEKPHSAVNITMQLIQLEQEKATLAVTASSSGRGGNSSGGGGGGGGSNRNQPAMDR